MNSLVQHATSNNDLLDVARLQTGVAKGLLARVNGALSERAAKGLKLQTEELEVDVLGPRSTHANEGRAGRQQDGQSEQPTGDHCVSSDGNPFKYETRETPTSLDDPRNPRVGVLGPRSVHSDEGEVDLGLRGRREFGLAAVDGAPNEMTDEGLELRAEELKVDVLGSRSVHSDEREVDLGLRGRGKLGRATVDRALNERTDEGLELRAEELKVDVFGSRSVHSDEREVDLGLCGRGKLGRATVDRALNERTDEGLELRAEELKVDVFGSRSVHSDEREVDLGLRGRGKLNFGLPSRLPNALYCHGVAGEIETGVFLEPCEDVFDKGNVEIFAAKVGVAVGRLDLKNATLQLEDGDIERSTAQIVDSHNVFSRLVHTARKGGSSRFIWKW